MKLHEAITNVPAILLAVVASGLLASPGQAQEHQPDEQPPDLWAALTGGDAWLKFRYRYESVDQRGFDKEARASTLRTVLGYETLPYLGVRGLIELEDVRSIGDDAYNSTTNGRTDRPVVADPEGIELNQAYFEYDTSSGTIARLGRQRIMLDNHRFVGNVGWRQNEQTFDALSVSHPIGEAGNLFYALLENVNTIFGQGSPVGDTSMGSSLFNASYDVEELGKIVGYWYYLDYDSSDTLSTSTLGARLSGRRPVAAEVEALYSLEYAHQGDIGDNPNDVDAGYFLAEIGAEVSGVSLKLGHEVLEGSTDPGNVFTTPLATLHAFNGWADKFLTPSMPGTGIEDSYVSVSAKLDRATLQAVYHDFGSEATSSDYGTELDLMASFRINDTVSWGLKYANYMEDGFATDTEKIWAWLSVAP